MQGFVLVDNTGKDRYADSNPPCAGEKIIAVTVLMHERERANDKIVNDVLTGEVSSNAEYKKICFYCKSFAPHNVFVSAPIAQCEKWGE